MTGKPVIQVDASLDPPRRAWIYHATGKLIGTRTCYDFLEQARDRIAGGVPNVVIDLARVTMLNSTGIGIIASLYNSAKEQGGKIYLVGADAKQVRPLVATHVWEFLGKCDSLDDLPARL